MTELLKTQPVTLPTLSYAEWYFLREAYWEKPKPPVGLLAKLDAYCAATYEEPKP